MKQVVRNANPVAVLEDLCRRYQLPVTVQRRVIYRFLSERNDHPTAEHVYEGVRDRIPGVSRTTVYRVLNTLVGIGAVKKVCSPGVAVRFDAETRRHHHLVCTACDRLIDYEDEALNNLPLPDVRSKGFRVDDYSIQFRGICAECRRKSGQPAGKKRGSRIKRKRGRRGQGRAR